MRIPKKGVFYALYTIIVLTAFLYLLFPSEEIKKYLAFKVSTARPGYALNIDQVRPAFPPGLRLASADLLEGENPVLTIDEIRISPRLLSLLGSEPTVDFTGRLYSGIFRGNGSLLEGNSETEGPDRIRVDADLTDIHLEEIDPLRNMSTHSVSGNLTGKIRYLGNPVSSAAEADLNVADCTIEFGTPLFNLAQISFAAIDAKLTLQDMKQLEVKECVAKGSQLGGDVSGAVTLRDPPENSTLNLSGTVKPHTSLVAKLGEGVVSLLFRKNRGETAFPFRITGTLAQPQFALQ
ncbi:MAG: type II secretion system protein GspN [Thermodesulfobacteriota bacterium]